MALTSLLAKARIDLFHERLGAVILTDLFVARG
jgi:hypothetical protein